jgi:hypothetical protein
MVYGRSQKIPQLMARIGFFSVISTVSIMGSCLLKGFYETPRFFFFL